MLIPVAASFLKVSLFAERDTDKATNTGPVVADEDDKFKSQDASGAKK